MKKPKKKKPAPKYSWIVDYGDKRVVLPYRVTLEKFYNEEITAMIKWCEKTYAVDTWRRGGIYPGYMYFVKESDATLFRLKWAK